MKTKHNDLQDLLKDILEIPERVKRIDPILKKELLLHVDKGIERILDSINNLLLANTNYEYPKEYLPNKKLEYWSERVSHVFNLHELRYLKEVISNSLRTSENSTKENLKDPDCYPFKKNEVLECFKEYTQNHIIDSYTDYSYLFQRLLKVKLIYPMTHKDFMKWLFENQYIKETTLENFLLVSQFKSLSKSHSASRINNFNNIFKNYI